MIAAHYVVVCNLWNDFDGEVIELTVLEPMPNIVYGGNNNGTHATASWTRFGHHRSGTWSMSSTLPMGLSFDNPQAHHRDGHPDSTRRA